MTDNEIIKALECCSQHSSRNRHCVSMFDALDLINRQKAEMERLYKENDRLSQCVLYHDGQIVDAVKEFAERCKDLFLEEDEITRARIDNLLKEMVGEDSSPNNKNN